MPMETPVGRIDAELITFYDDGAVNRVFPLNGLIDGYWSEANEREIAETIELELSTGTLKAKIISLHFYPSGELKSVTVWPGETMDVRTPLGAMAGRAGLSFYESGEQRSVEPAGVTAIPSPIGLIKAFNPDIIGMHADLNSVQFDAYGELTAVTTLHSGVNVDPSDKVTRVLPYEIASYIDATQMRTVPIQIQFTIDSVEIDAQEHHSYPILGHKFTTFESKRMLRDTCGNCPGEDDAAFCQNGGSCGGCGGS